jgi:hypothetical protein
VSAKIAGIGRFWPPRYRGVSREAGCPEGAVLRGQFSRGCRRFPGADLEFDDDSRYELIVSSLETPFEHFRNV